MTEGQRIIRCSLGGEQFLFVHEEASYEEKANLAEHEGISADMRATLDPTGYSADFPWTGFVHSAALNEWIYRGQFNNAQVANLVDFTVGLI